PVRAGFVPGYPRAAPPIHGDGGMRLEFGTRRQRMQLPELAILIGAEVDVIVSLVVGVPGDVGCAVRSGGHGRLPIVGRRLADAELVGPLPRGQRAHEDVALAAAVTLPDQEDLAVRRGGGAQERVRSFSRQPLGSLPRRALLLASPDLPAVIEALAPEDPQVARVVGGRGAAEDVAGLGGHLFGRRP